MPTFESFKPHFDTLNLGGEHLGIDTERNSEDAFDADGYDERSAEQRSKKIALDELQEELVKHYPTRKAEDTKAKGNLLEAIFNTRSWERISSDIKSETLQWGLLKLRWFLNEVDSDTRNSALNTGENPNDAINNIKGLLDAEFPED
jgi:hypothetical protein